MPGLHSALPAVRYLFDESARLARTMKLIDLIELLVKNSEGLNKQQRADAKVLLTELRNVNAFGTVVTAANGRHMCVPRYVHIPPYSYAYGRTGRDFYVCEICGREMNNV